MHIVAGLTVLLLVLDFVAGRQLHFSAASDTHSVERRLQNTDQSSQTPPAPPPPPPPPRPATLQPAHRDNFELSTWVCSWVTLLVTGFLAVYLHLLDKRAQERAASEEDNRRKRAASEEDNRRKRAAEHEELEMGMTLKKRWDQVGSSIPFLNMSRHLFGEVPPLCDQVAEPCVSSITELNQRLVQLCYDHQAPYHDLQPNDLDYLTAKWGANLFWDELAAVAAPQLDAIEAAAPMSAQAALQAAAALPQSAGERALSRAGMVQYMAQAYPPALAALVAAANAAAANKPPLGVLLAAVAPSDEAAQGSAAAAAAAVINDPALLDTVQKSMRHKESIAKQAVEAATAASATPASVLAAVLPAAFAVDPAVCAADSVAADATARDVVIAAGKAAADPVVQAACQYVTAHPGCTMYDVVREAAAATKDPVLTAAVKAALQNDATAAAVADAVRLAVAAQLDVGVAAGKAKMDAARAPEDLSAADVAAAIAGKAKNPALALVAQAAAVNGASARNVAAVAAAASLQAATACDPAVAAAAEAAARTRATAATVAAAAVAAGGIHHAAATAAVAAAAAAADPNPLPQHVLEATAAAVNPVGHAAQAALGLDGSTPASIAAAAADAATGASFSWMEELFSVREALRAVCVADPAPSAASVLLAAANAEPLPAPYQALVVAARDAQSPIAAAQAVANAKHWQSLVAALQMIADARVDGAEQPQVQDVAVVIAEAGCAVAAKAAAAHKLKQGAGAGRVDTVAAARTAVVGQGAAVAAADAAVVQAAFTAACTAGASVQDVVNAVTNGPSGQAQTAALAAIKQVQGHAGVTPLSVADAVAACLHPAVAAARTEAATPGATAASVAAAAVAAIFGHDCGVPAAVSALSAPADQVFKMLEALGEAAVEVMPGAASVAAKLTEPGAVHPHTALDAAWAAGVAAAAASVWKSTPSLVSAGNAATAAADEAEATPRTVLDAALAAFAKAADSAAAQAAQTRNEHRYDHILDSTPDLLQAAVTFMLVVEPLNYIWHVYHDLHAKNMAATHPDYDGHLRLQPARSRFAEQLLVRGHGFASSGVLTSGWRARMPVLFQQFFTRCALHHRFAKHGRRGGLPAEAVPTDFD